MNRRFILPALTVLIGGMADEASAQPTFSFNGSNQPTSISGLTIGGVDYDVTFEYGGSFNDRYGAGGDRFSWRGPGVTLNFGQAANGVAAALNANGLFPNPRTILAFPISANATDFVGGAVESRNRFDDYDLTQTFPASRTTNNPFPGASVGFPVVNLASATAVPEPSSLYVWTALMAVGGCGYVVRMGRRRLGVRALRQR